ncbi:hypothetical protein, conserved [Trypanosoma brucei brucei TREU927]|uniref:Sister chromatid cohesion protein DCC1 n=1 Tax=Trypanosoma brucei brucei (strain 927/4 GUTat10.1) TaxID=185431 RepID=Q57UZ8_TRYB2|nr:hypothetical protein, conserved [Trypanosoma brucei brucei TREU927]AAX70571.1 hypothetical protein, conserved [Trypanosoma brucei]AAZ12277.1 hypothetical protein, conserved [Trypanosoma brucei brucei TREU927]
MARVTLREDFDDCAADYRILSVSADHFKEITCKVAACKQTGEEMGKINETHHEATTLMTMKGGSQLLLCDDERTFRVRRVEYSNTLLLAEAKAAKMHDTNGIIESDNASDAGEGREHVVVCSSERVFEVKPSVAYNDISQHLLESPLTLKELDTLGTVERSDENVEYIKREELENGTSSSAQRFYTFPQLVALNRSSARELAVILSDMGAVVFNGYVRLLKPALMREALRASLNFFDAYDTMSWEGVMEQLCPSVYPHIVLRAVRAAYGNATASGETPRGMAAFLQVPKVLQALAASVLLADDAEQNTQFTEAELQDKKLSKSVNRRGSLFPELDFDIFYDSWTSSIPSSLFADGTLPSQSDRNALLKFLYGSVIVVRNAEGDSHVGARAVWAPSNVLSTDVSLRTRQLFEIRPGRWEAEELRAYVAPLLDPGVAFDHIIVRYAKEYRVPGRPVMYGNLS